MRRLELQKRYEDGQRAAAEAAKAEEAEAEQRAIAERRKKQADMKAAREASEAKRHRLAVVQAKMQLAEMHCSRRVLIDCGWQPWRALVYYSQYRMQRAAEHRTCALTRPPLEAWAKLTRRAKATRCCRRAVELIDGQRLRARHDARRGLLNFASGVKRQARGVTAARRLLSLRTLRRLWCAWAALTQLTRDRAEAEALRWEMAADAISDGMRARRALRAWSERAKEWRLESRERACKEELWKKVNRWLGDLDGGTGIAPPPIAMSGTTSSQFR